MFCFLADKPDTPNSDSKSGVAVPLYLALGKRWHNVCVATATLATENYVVQQSHAIWVVGRSNLPYPCN